MAYRVLLNLGLDLANYAMRSWNYWSGIPGYGQQPETVKAGKTPAIDAYGRNLNKLAREGKLDR